MQKACQALAILCALLITQAGRSADAAEVKVLCAAGMQDVLEDLGPKFERATGHKLTLAFATGGATIKRASDGEAIDVVIAPAEGISTLVKGGKVAASAPTQIAHSIVSVAIRKGAVKPDISTPEAFKRALLAAKSVTYLNPADGGASGIHFARVLGRLGIADDMIAKTVFAPRAGALGGMVARGEAEIGVVQFQLLFSVPGIDIIGPLPGDLQQTTIFSAAIMGASKDLQTAQALIAFLRTPEAVGGIKAKGMEPG